MGTVNGTSRGFFAAQASSGASEGSSVARSPFPRYSERGKKIEGWVPVDMGGHEVVGRLHLQMRPGAEAAGEARHALGRLEGSVNNSGLDVLRLLVTELVTNSVRHGSRADRDWIELDVLIYSNAVRAEVSDPGPGFVPKTTPEPHADRPGGWGLCLVDSLADRWGVGGEDRTRVWFELDRGRQPWPATA
jgi:anti-sigma regulatory factor (Ser/Thr protein kinase)